MAYERTDRIAQAILKELSDLIRSELKDTQMLGMCSLVHCQVTRDLRHAKVYVSLFNPPEGPKVALEVLEKAAGFLRAQLGRRIKTHYTPELHFVLDESIAYGVHMSQVIDRVVGEGKENPDDSPAQ